MLALPLLMLCPNHYQARHHNVRESRSELTGHELNCGVSTGNGLANYMRYGLHYEFLKEFSKKHECNVSIHAIRDTVSFGDSLLNGTYDIIILPEGGHIDKEGVFLHYSPDSSIVWATTAKEAHHALIFDTWIAYASCEDEDLSVMTELFNADCHHKKHKDTGISRKYISPYDNLIRRYAETMGWDWRLYAALIFKESRFSPTALSPKGAMGLAQVQPSSVEKFNAGDLFDPEENLRVGSLYLNSILNRINEEGITPGEKIKIALASYNAGFYRIAEARQVAAEAGLDSNVWDDIVEAFKLMPGFDGTATILYVERVIETYQNYVLTYPEK